MADTIKISGRFTIKMSIDEFKKWYRENKESIHKLSSKYINHRIVIMEDKGNLYKYIRRKDEGLIVPRETLKSKRQMVDDIEKLKTLYNELEFMEDKLRHYNDLLVMKGIDVEQQSEESNGIKPKNEYVNYGSI